MSLECPPCYAKNLLLTKDASMVRLDMGNGVLKVVFGRPVDLEELVYLISSDRNNAAFFHPETVDSANRKAIIEEVTSIDTASPTAELVAIPA